MFDADAYKAILIIIIIIIHEHLYLGESALNESFKNKEQNARVSTQCRPY